MTIERLSANDVMELECDVSGTSMQVAAVLVLESPAPLHLSAVRASLAVRIAGVRRLRQRLLVGPLGCGRPVWVDAADFDIEQHVRSVRCTAPGKQQEMLDAVAEIITHRLPPDRPLWSATLIEGLADGRAALVLVFHHALADGIGGLAVLEQLLDNTPAAIDPDFPRPRPDNRALLLDSLRSRAAAVRRLPAGLARMRSATTELRGSGTPPAPRGSLNRPIGTGRALALVTIGLAEVKAAGRSRGATVNDVILTAVAGAIGTVLAGRGEQVDRLVISVPVSARRPGSSTGLGNEVGVMPVEVPTKGAAPARLAEVASRTRERRTATPGSSAALIAPVFRILAKLGIFGWFVSRQHRVNTFVSNLSGPAAELTFLGGRVITLLPVPMITGNISVTFGVLSYAGRLQLTLLADPAQCPDLAELAAALQDELALLCAPSFSVPQGSGQDREGSF